MVASLSHQNHESQSEQQIQVGSLPKGKCSVFKR